MADDVFKSLARALLDRDLTIGSVESLTGGLFAARLCEVPGISASYLGSLITYDPRLKTSLAGVDPEVIEKYGVVSNEVAYEMAKGGQKVLTVDVCISCTGNAGPTVQKGDKPVGTVCIGIAYKDQVSSEEMHIDGVSRNTMRELVSEAMAEKILKLF